MSFFLSFQALMAAEEFRKDVINIPGMSQHDGWSDLSAAKLALEQLRAFRCEGLICMALIHVLSKSASATSMKWSRDVVRNALGDVSGGAFAEDALHPLLLQECRKFIG